MALSFLTVFPATWNRTPTQGEISNSRTYYPVIGLLLGLLLVGIERGAREVFPVYLTAVLLLVLLVALTRGLHLDGFMDVCDGLFGGYTRERRLEIMWDSHVGAFPYARRDGLGSPFHQGRARLATVIAAAIAAAASVLAGGIGGAGILVGVSILVWFLGWVVSRMLGGLTGDTYGATNELAEVVALIAAVALLPQGWIKPLFPLSF